MTAFDLNNLLDMCSKFAEGQDKVQTVEVRPKMKPKSKPHTKSPSREALEYAKYIGYRYTPKDQYSFEDNDDDCFLRSSEEEEEKEKEEWQQRAKPLKPNVSAIPGKRKIPRNQNGKGRGRMFHPDFKESSRFIPKILTSNLQEQNDLVISEQLRELGCGISNDDIENEFLKKFGNKNSPVEEGQLENASGGSNDDLENEFYKKFRNKSSPVEEVVSNKETQDDIPEEMPKRRDAQTLYVPPHRRKACAASTSNHHPVEVKAVSPAGSSPMKLTASRVKTIYEISSDDNDDGDDDSIYIGSPVTTKESKSNFTDDRISFSPVPPTKPTFTDARVCLTPVGGMKPSLSDDKINFCPIKEPEMKSGSSSDRVNESPVNESVINQSKPSLIQFRIKSNISENFNHSGKANGVTRNALINGLLKRKPDVKILSEHCDAKQSLKVETRTVPSESKDEDGDRCLGKDDFNNNFKKLSVESIKDYECNSSGRSSVSNVKYNENSEVYFIAPVSKKKIIVSKPTGYMDIVANNMKSLKPTSPTLADFMSIPNTLSEVDSSLNPFAAEFSPNSNNKSCCSSDTDGFHLDIDEFPPL